MALHSLIYAYAVRSPRPDPPPLCVLFRGMFTFIERNFLCLAFSSKIVIYLASVTFSLTEPLDLYFEVDFTYRWPLVEIYCSVSRFATGLLVFNLTSPRLTHIATQCFECSELIFVRNNIILYFLGDCVPIKQKAITDNLEKQKGNEVEMPSCLRGKT